MNEGWREAVYRRALVVPDSGVNVDVWPQVSAQGQEKRFHSRRHVDKLHKTDGAEAQGQYED